MTDQTNLSDSGQSKGNEGTPIPPVSNADGDKPNSGQQIVITKEQLDDLLTRAAERGAQSGKDRAVSQTNKRLDQLEGDIRPVLERAKREGKSVDDVLGELDQQEEIEMRRAMREIATYLREGKLPVSVAGKQPEQGVDAAQVFTTVGLDIKDHDVAIALAKRYETPEQAELAALRLKDRKANQPNPTEAQEPSINGGPPLPPDLSALQREYEKRAAEIGKNPGRQAELKSEYRRKGLKNLY